MFIPRQNSNSFSVFYMGTDPNMPEPGKQILELHKNGIKLKIFKSKGFINKEQITKSEVGYEVVKSGLSRGGALAGGLLAGVVGAIAGASMGSKKVEPHVTIFYKDTSGQEQQVVLVSRLAKKINSKVSK